MTGFNTPCRMYEPEADAWLSLPVPPEKLDVRVQFARMVRRAAIREEFAQDYFTALANALYRGLPEYRAFGKQVKHGDTHVADAVDGDTAERIAAALNGETV